MSRHCGTQYPSVPSLSTFLGCLNWEPIAERRPHVAPQGGRALQPVLSCVVVSQRHNANRPRGEGSSTRHGGRSTPHTGLRKSRPHLQHGNRHDNDRSCPACCLSAGTAASITRVDRHCHPSSVLSAVNLTRTAGRTLPPKVGGHCSRSGPTGLSHTAFSARMLCNTAR